MFSRLVQSWPSDMQEEMPIHLGPCFPLFFLFLLLVVHTGQSSFRVALEFCCLGWSHYFPVSKSTLTCVLLLPSQWVITFFLEEIFSTHVVWLQEPINIYWEFFLSQCHVVAVNSPSFYHKRRWEFHMGSLVDSSDFCKVMLCRLLMLYSSRFRECACYSTTGAVIFSQKIFSLPGHSWKVRNVRLLWYRDKGNTLYLWFTLHLLFGLSPRAWSSFPSVSSLSKRHPP